MGKRVVIVDDTVFMRMSLKIFLESFDYEVVKEGSDGFEAVTLYKRLKPDIITIRQVSVPLSCFMPSRPFWPFYSCQLFFEIAR